MTIPPASAPLTGEKLEVEPARELKRKRGARRGTTKPRVPTVEKLTANWQKENLRSAQAAIRPGNLVELKGFNFPEFAEQVGRGRVGLKNGRAQSGLPPRRLAVEDGSRVVTDDMGNFVLGYFPEFWGKATRLRMLREIDELTRISPLITDSEKRSDKRQGSIPGMKGKATYWSIFQHGIAQHNKYPANVSTSLQSGKGEVGRQAREDFLMQRAVNTNRINHMVKLLRQDLYDALRMSQNLLRMREDQVGNWARKWESIFPSMGLMENRQSGLHRDQRGAQHAGDFLYLLGSFKGGDLFFQDLNLSLEWLPGSAVIFDGRTLAHQVREWQGSRRVCVVHYLWETPFRELGVDLPGRTPHITEISSWLDQAAIDLSGLESAG
ncbi:hypothetical protein FRC11_008748 [Ceratobasidium sp. 423]|nr:hypothetical protein FRC11_008748 [Ceratobasidium sp. 423]